MNYDELRKEFHMLFPHILVDEEKALDWFISKLEPLEAEIEEFRQDPPSDSEVNTYQDTILEAQRNVEKLTAENSKLREWIEKKNTVIFSAQSEIERHTEEAKRRKDYPCHYCIAIIEQSKAALALGKEIDENVS